MNSVLMLNNDKNDYLITFVRFFVLTIHVNLIQFATSGLML